MPADPKYHTQSLQSKWCLDSAVVYLSNTWQEGQPFEFVHVMVAAVPDPDCSTVAFRELRNVR